MKKILVIFPLLVVLLVAALLINTVRFTSVQQTVDPVAPMAVDEAAVVERLAGAVRIRTISQDGQPADAQAFRDLHEYLEQNFPQAHAAMRKEIVGYHSVLYTWQGRNPDLKPVVLLAHLDVVPVDEEATQWTHPPFAGQIADGFVWGRGTLDDKAMRWACLKRSSAWWARTCRSNAPCCSHSATTKKWGHWCATDGGAPARAQRGAGVCAG